MHCRKSTTVVQLECLDPYDFTRQLAFIVILQVIPGSRGQEK